MWYHFHGFVVVVLDKYIISKRNTYRLTVIIGLEKQVEILLNHLILLFLL